VGALSPETWPILGAFLVLQSLITFPLVRYIQLIHKAQLEALDKSCESRITDLRAQQAALVTIYTASTEYAQRRGDLLHAEKETLIKQLDAMSQQTFRAVDALSELRGASQDLTKARRSS